MPKRHLLLCFDAFGTLFNPKRPIPQQYGDIARSLGHTGFTDDQVQASFKAAFKSEAKQNPNFGKANGLNPTTWWTNIIHNTFQPLIGQDRKLHAELAPRLLHRFASKEGYHLASGILSLLHIIRTNPPSSINQLAIGVVTNSDDRVPGILISLGLRVSPLVYGSHFSTPDPTEDFDIDLTVMSYDVGHEKPDPRIFTAAEEMLLLLPVAQGTTGEEWQKVYVGDEYGKDVIGAREAGWGAVLLDPEGVDEHQDVVKSGQGQGEGELLDVLRTGQAVSVSSFDMLARGLGLAPNRSEVS